MCTWSLWLAESLPRLASLVPIGLGALAALGAYLAVATGGVGRLRALMA